jgi:hypothetical protein
LGSCCDEDFSSPVVFGLGITSPSLTQKTVLSLYRTSEGHIMKTSLHLSSSERGDVPGWVLITLMTAGLVVVIWSAAGPALSGVFEQAITRVTGF